MLVWLGLSLDPNYWQGVFDPAASAAANTALMLELEALYGDSPALAGYYLPEEIDDRSFVSATAHEAMIQYLAAMVAAAHDQVGRPVMVAPYFGMAPNGETYAAWWDTTLARAPVDVIAMQDGVGTRRTTAAEGVPVYAALAPVAAKHNVALWSDLEVFEQTHSGPRRPCLAGPARAYRDGSGTVGPRGPYVAKFVTFVSPTTCPRLGGLAASFTAATRSTWRVGNEDNRSRATQQHASGRHPRRAGESAVASSLADGGYRHRSLHTGLHSNRPDTSHLLVRMGRRRSEVLEGLIAEYNASQSAIARARLLRADRMTGAHPRLAGWRCAARPAHRVDWMVVPLGQAARCANTLVRLELRRIDAGDYLPGIWDYGAYRAPSTVCLPPSRLRIHVEQGRVRGSRTRPGAPPRTIEELDALTTQLTTVDNRGNMRRLGSTPT